MAEQSLPSIELPLERPAAEDAAVDLLARVFGAAPAALQRMKDGITNVVLCATFAADCAADRAREAHTVLIRIYGKNTEAIIDRQAELRTHRDMHSHGMAPPLYATFANGYIYGFVEGTPTAPPQLQLPTVAPLVARRVAQLHRLPLPADAKPTVFSTLRRYHEQVIDSMATSPLREKWLASCSWDALAASVAELEEAATALVSPRTVVFCHNDLLAGNVIVLPSEDAVNFIDYEYASANYRGYDIGNHFNEQCGLTEVDYSKYPSKPLQEQWLRSYLAEYSGIPESEVAAHDIETLYHETQLFALASHLFWGIWAMVQANCSTIDFDYFGYSLLRLAEYRRRRQQVLDEARAYLSQKR